MNIVFVGPPGSGKGTRASRVAPKLGIPHIAVGDIFREAIAKETPMGKKAKEYYDAGKPVPNEIATKIIIERLNQEDCKDGFILDSPYNREQAEEIDKNKKIDIAIYLDIPEEILIKRLSTRRICKECGAVYNIKTLKPEKEGICDKCGGELYQRDDDKPKAIKKRIESFRKRIDPLLDYYKEREILLNAGFKKEEIPEGKEDLPLDMAVSRTIEKIENFS